MLQLIEPLDEWETAYRDLVQEFQLAGEHSTLLWEPERRSFAEHVAALRTFAQGRDLPEGWVPASRYWLISEEQILGEIDIRHELTPALEDYGGHIGYYIRPGRRGEGFGSKMLELALEKARKLGLERVLITCDPKNAASVRVIEKNGGVLRNQSVAHIGRLTSRYWIEL
jgi:predicted acetyltransferase